VDVDVHNVHANVLERYFRLYFSEPYKLPWNTDGTNPAVDQYIIKLHQTIYLLMVDDITFILKFIPNILIAITAEILLKDGLHILDD